jgi:GNAT superfamily N-acetyltransferase
VKTPLDVRILESVDKVELAFPLLRELRPHLVAAEFAGIVRQQRENGYVLAGGFVAGRMVAAAGYRLTATLAWGPHLFVDDLVTAAADRGKGYGIAMIDWLRARARAVGVPRVYLDSRDTAVGFYARAGFTFLTAKPCWVDA